MATITLRESGRWQAKVRRNRGQTTSMTFRTKAAAEAWARNEEDRIERGVLGDQTMARRISVAELLQDYERQVAAKARSRELMGYHLARFREDLGHLRLAALTPAVLAKWRDERLKCVKPATVARELSTLGGALTWARKDLLIGLPENPVGAIRRPTEDRARDRRLLGAEEEALLEAMEDRCRSGAGTKRTGNYRTGSRNPWLKPVVLLALETAMRQGELLALRWSDVDLEERTASLHTTKNGDARTVPLSSKAVAILQSLPRDPDCSTQVFPVTSSSLKQSWERVVDRARKTYVQRCLESGQKASDTFLTDLRFHDLRHEATSRLALKLPNLIELAAVTGHRDLRMVKRYYHPRASELARKLG